MMSLPDDGIPFGIAALAAVVSAIMLFAASGGYHPYSYYEWMRLVVLVSGGCAAWAFLKYAKGLAVGGVVLAALGIFFFFARMRRADWPPFDVAGALAYLAAGLYAGFRCARSAREHAA